jgi:hypothetical protein
MAKKKPTQPEMPGMGVESLPLFSGTPQRVEVAAPETSGVATGRQMSMFECPVCRDTGKVGTGARARYCWCRAGEDARQWDRDLAASQGLNTRNGG